MPSAKAGIHGYWIEPYNIRGGSTGGGGQGGNYPPPPNSKACDFVSLHEERKRHFGTF